MTALSLDPPLSTPSRAGNSVVAERLAWSSTVADVAGHRRHILVVSSATGLRAVRIGRDPEALRAEVDGEFGALPTSADDLAPTLDALTTLAHGLPCSTDLPLDVEGTPFQLAVWSALAAIPRGHTRTYTQVASEIGQPTAVRAVARACAVNPVALVVPCHRVVRTDGVPSGYRWGLELKSALLAAEERAAR